MFTLDDLKQTRYFQDVIKEAEVEIAREYILKLLKICFTDDIPYSFVEKLNQIEDLPCLDDIYEKTITTKSITEFR